MRAVSEPGKISEYRALASEMIEGRDIFRPGWVEKSGWVVVPAESAGRLLPEDIPRLSSTFSGAGFHAGFVVMTEDLGYTPSCYEVDLSPRGLEDLNREIGLFQFLLTERARSWAIACTIDCNLFAGPERLVELMIGKSVKAAKAEFRQLADQIDLFRAIAKIYT